MVSEKKKFTDFVTRKVDNFTHINNIKIASKSGFGMEDFFI